MRTHTVIVKFFGNTCAKKYNREKIYKTFDPITVGPSTDSLDTRMPRTGPFDSNTFVRCRR